MEYYLVDFYLMDYYGFVVLDEKEFRAFLKRFEEWENETPKPVESGDAHFGYVNLQHFVINKLTTEEAKTLDKIFGSDYGIHPINEILDWEQYYG